MPVVAPVAPGRVLASAPPDAGEHPVVLVRYDEVAAPPRGPSRHEVLARRRRVRRSRRARRALVGSGLALSMAGLVPVLAAASGDPAARAVPPAAVGVAAAGPGAVPAPAALARRLVTVDVPLPAPTEVRTDDDLARGEQRIVEDGAPGLRRDVLVAFPRAADLVRFRRVAGVVATAPVPRVVVVGTEAVNDASAPTGRPTVLEWHPTGHSQVGRATWYQWRSGWCAHNTLPKGTVLRITNLDNGRVAYCRVMDRGIRSPENLVDLSPDVFDDLAPRRDGVVRRALVEW